MDKKDNEKNGGGEEIDLISLYENATPAGKQWMDEQIYKAFEQYALDKYKKEQEQMAIEKELKANEKK